MCAEWSNGYNSATRPLSNKLRETVCGTKYCKNPSVIDLIVYYISFSDSQRRVQSSSERDGLERSADEPEGRTVLRTETTMIINTTQAPTVRDSCHSVNLQSHCPPSVLWLSCMCAIFQYSSGTNTYICCSSLNPPAVFIARCAASSVHAHRPLRNSHHF